MSFTLVDSACRGYSMREVMGNCKWGGGDELI
jgi:hypothetical protein